MKTVRLDKFLSENTALSRSQIRTAVKRGEVSVNEKVIYDFSLKISPDEDSVCLNGEIINNKKFIYLLLNKPSGILTASRDKSRETVLDLVPEEFKHYDLFAVGRLDKDTTGLLLITNDGDYAHRVISPKSNVEKDYIATVDGTPQKNAVSVLAEGVTLADGTACRPAKLEFLNDDVVRVTITEGKYHQVKRLLGFVGLGVKTLHRERIGSLCLPDNLNAGSITEINSDTAMLVFK
ncbi:MAG: pseudouridine synthase [Acutalibacteraceae bacterium]|nr:pseudouridine synthase [Acutalibacteraceae bacterium]